MSEQCSERVYTDRWGDHQCSRMGTVFEEDKWYCKQHSPEGSRARKTAQQERWAAQSKGANEAWTAGEEQRRRAECFPDLLAALEECRSYLALGKSSEYLEVVEDKRGTDNDLLGFYGKEALLLRHIGIAIEKGEGGTV